MAHKPTPEQKIAVELFNTRVGLKVSAFAGSGKTTTLKMLAKQRSSKGLYIAFNKAIADEAKEDFPRTVDCRTTHSLAFRPISGKFRYSSGKMTAPFYARNLADALSLEDKKFERIKLDGLGQAYLALGAIRRFCQSADPELSEKHVPQYGRLAGASPEELREVRSWALDMAKSVWTRMLDHRDRLPLGHDGYLKLWALQEPVIAADFILLDEAQDSNPAVLSVLAKQSAQVVYVGDKHQQIYEWRGAINAMEKIEGCEEAYLTQSFRFGEAIASAASAVLRTLGETRPIVGNPAVVSVIGPQTHVDAVLARTNAGVMSSVIDALQQETVPHVVGGVDAIKNLLKDVVSLKGGQPGKCPEFLGFADWSEVLEFVRQEEGEELRTFVQIVERFGERHLLWAMNRVQEKEEGAQIVISTAHKAKGREWNAVRLTNDFVSSRAEEPYSPDDAEARLFYVAMTRAKRALDVASEVLAAFTQRQRRTRMKGMERGSKPTFEARVTSSNGTALTNRGKTVHHPAPQRQESAPVITNEASGPSTRERNGHHSLGPEPPRYSPEWEDWVEAKALTETLSAPKHDKQPPMTTTQPPQAQKARVERSLLGRLVSFMRRG